MRVTCTNCGGSHPVFECKSAAKKSTDAREIGPVIKGQAHAMREGHERTAAEPGTKVASALSATALDVANQGNGRGTKPKAETVSAGKKALPVDTNSLQDQNASSGNADGSKPLTQTRPAKFDKKAWMRANMPAYMKRYRAEVKAGLRTPKPRSER